MYVARFSGRDESGLGVLAKHKSLVHAGAAGCRGRVPTAALADQASGHRDLGGHQGLRGQRPSQTRTVINCWFTKYCQAIHLSLSNTPRAQITVMKVSIILTII